MAPLCLLYFAAVAICLAAAGHLVDRALPREAQRRWIWCVALAGAVILPPVFSAQHSSHVIDLWGRELVRIPSAEPNGSGSVSGLGVNWLECSAAYGQTILRLWLVGTLLLLLWGIANALRVGRLIRGARGRANVHGSVAVVDGVEVILTESLGPATAGLVRSRVLLPRWVLTLPAPQRRYVVRHEEEHRRSNDARLLCVASVLVALMPWNIPLWWMLHRLQLAVEMDCDRRVVAALGDAATYGELLLTVAEASSRGSRLQPALLGGVGMLERRLTTLLAPARRRVADRLVAPLLALVLLAVVFSVPHPQPVTHAQVHRHTPASVPSTSQVTEAR